MSSITLALSGGAARGAYHLGVLQYIDENSIKVEAICGTSIGAIIGTSYASGVKPKEQLEIFKSKEFKDIFSFAYFNKSLYKIDSATPVLNKLMPYKNLEELKIPLYITALDMYSGVNKTFTTGNILDICLASSALFPFFAPVRLQNSFFVDGGIIDHLPIEPLKKYDYPIAAINLHPVDGHYSKNRFFGNLKRVLFLNIFAKKDYGRNFCDHYITSLKLRDYSIFSFKHLDELFELGYKDAKKLLVLNK